MSSADLDRGMRRAVLADGLAGRLLAQIRGFPADDHEPLVREIVKMLIATMSAAAARELVVDLAKATLRKRAV